MKARIIEMTILGTALALTSVFTIGLIFGVMGIARNVGGY